MCVCYCLWTVAKIGYFEKEIHQISKITKPKFVSAHSEQFCFWTPNEQISLPKGAHNSSLDLKKKMFQEVQVNFDVFDAQ